MKNFIKSFAFIFVLSAMLFACQSKTEPQDSQIGVLNEGDCKVISATYSYKKAKIDIFLSYDEKNRVSDFKRYTNDFKEREVKIKYNEEDQIVKYEIYNDDTLSSYETAIWKNDKCLTSLYNYKDGQWVNENKVALTYDNEGQIILLDDYTVDSNNVWSAKGTLYDYVWENNNVTSVTNYVVVEDTIKARTTYKNDKDFLLVHIDDEEYIVDSYSDLKTFYTSTIEYYDTPNPLYHLSIAHVVTPNDFNCSKNAIKKITKTYDNDELIVFTFSYTNNEKGYPTNVDVNVDFTSPTETLNKKYSMQFEYENCK